MKKYLLLLQIFCAIILVNAQNTTPINNNLRPTSTLILTAQSGNWNDPLTWQGGVVPNISNCIGVKINHQVIVTANAAIFGGVLVEGGSLTINDNVSLNVDNSLDLNAYNFYIKNSTFTNKGNLYIYGRFNIETSTMTQNTPNASIVIHCSNGSSASSIPTTSSTFNSYYSDLTQVTNGLIQFLEPPFNNFTKTITIQGSSTFGSENSDLTLKFGGSANTINTLNPNGFEVLTEGSLETFNVRKLLIDNGTYSPQLVSFYGIYAPTINSTTLVADTIDIENGELRANNEASVGNYNQHLPKVQASRIINKGIFTIGDLYWQPKLLNTNVLIVENGIWRNKVVSSTLKMDKLIVGNQYPQMNLKIGTPNFRCNTLELKDNLFLDNDTIIVDDYNIGAQQGKIIYTNGDGKLKLKIPGNINFNTIGSFVPLGTNRGEALLGIVRDASVTTEPDDYFYFSCKPITNELNVNQCLPMEWTVEEETPGGNDKLHFFANVRDTAFNTEHAAFFSKPFKKTGTTWNEITSVPYRIKKGYYYSEYYAFYPVFFNTSYNAIRGTFSFASGRGLSATEPYQATTKTGGSSNWSLPTIWTNNIVPTTNDIIFVKNTDSVYVDVNAICKSAQTDGTFIIPQNNSITIGNLGGDNGEIFNNGKFTIDTLATLNLNGRLFSEVIGTFGLKGGTINIDPNSGVEATSVTLSNYKNSPNPFHVSGYNDSLWGNINFKDPIYGGYLVDVNQVVSPYFSIYNNELAKPINFTYGDGISTNSTNDYFIINSTDLSRSNDNVTINLQGELRDTLFEYNTNGLNAHNFTINTGSAYIPEPSKEFQNGPINYVNNINGNVIVNGAFKGGINFNGSDSQSLTGAGKITNSTGFYHNNINNHSININVIDTIRAGNYGNMSFKFGSYILNNTNVEFNEVLSTSSTHFVITNGKGRLIAKVDAATATADGYFFPVGSNDTSFTPITIQTNTGHITDKIGVQVKDSVYVNGVNGAPYVSNVVNKTWNINEAASGGSNVNITARWDTENELSGFTNTSCGLSHYTGIWDAFVPSAANNSYTPLWSITRNNITSFSPFAVINSLASLPVNWLQVHGFVNYNKQAQINFKVQEQNVSSYTMQKSIDGIIFTDVITIASKGNGENYYTTTDALPLTKATYYRVKQNSLNGTSGYSKVIKLKPNNTNATLVQPTIASTTINLIISNLSLLHSKATVYNAIGQQVMQMQINTTSNIIPIANLLPGLYTIKLQDTTLVQFIKQ